MDILGISFDITTNDNVCPSELVSTLSVTDGEITQINANWGIKPDWANKLLINAQSETVSNKKTFKKAFLSSRCLIPISGWYEWKSDESGKKQKYLFSHRENVFYMAAIMYQGQSKANTSQALDLFGEPIEPAVNENEFVSLTTSADQQCRPIHSRMPLMIASNNVKQWLQADVSTAAELLHSQMPPLTITKAD